jgi:hypothetical protein
MIALVGGIGVAAGFVEDAFDPLIATLGTGIRRRTGRGRRIHCY